MVLSDLHQLQEKEERSQEKNLERPQYHCIPRILTLSFSHNTILLIIIRIIAVSFFSRLVE